MDKTYVLVTGGQLFNKGAQSMVYIVVDEVKKRFPDKEVILFSTTDFKRSDEEKDKYRFKIKNRPRLSTLFGLSGGMYKLISKIINNREEVQEAKGIFAKSDVMIDISGYSLGSNWGVSKCFSYVYMIKIAKKYDLPVYLLPQSFGPFDFKGIKGWVANKYIKKYLNLADLIFAREKEGYDLLRENYGLNSLKISRDIVLLNKGIDNNNIYHEPSKIKEESYSIKKNSVAIIPNIKNFQYGNKKEVLNIYELIIEQLLEQSKNVYLVRHSFEDLEVCKLIKDKFKDNDNVISISDDISCIGFNNLIKQFDFAVASRYHSIIHSYKNGISCVAMGWATKYHELLKSFMQEEYIFDVRSNINTTAIQDAIEKMLRNNEEESKTILKILKEIQTEDVFDIIGEEN